MDEAIDHQITLDPGGRNTRWLYEAARDNVEGPLVGHAADRLLEAIDPSTAVAIATGFPIPPSNRPETDGPLGAAVLARAIEQLGGKPMFVVDARTEPVVSAVAAAVGVERVETVSPATAESRLEGRAVGAVVAIETPGPTADGSYRTMAGVDITDIVDPVDGLVNRAIDRGGLTIAVGDGGNEIGMGAIRPAVEAHIEFGETIGCVTGVDDLVVAGVSNWGAYGLVAALSNRTDKRLLHTPADERRMLESAVDAGAIDGVSGQSTPSVDGIEAGVHEQIVGMLAALCDESE